MPIDNYFRAFSGSHDILYYRYMDDIRIFSRDITVARRVLFELETRIRRLHLNVQTAKTRILRETVKKPEISWFLIDDRVKKLQDIREKALDKKPSLSTKSAITRLKAIAREQPSNPLCQKLIGKGYRDKNDLSLRAMRMWMNISLSLRDDSYIGYLYSEINQNSDPRLMKIYINTVRTFPKQNRWQRQLISFLNSEFNIFPYQEAQVISGIRYFSEINSRLRERVKAIITTDEIDCCLKIEALLCAPRFLFTKAELAEVWKRYEGEQRWFLLPYYALVLSQQAGPDQMKLLTTLTRHPHPGVAMVGGFLVDVRSIEGRGRNFIQYTFAERHWTRIVDWLGVLWLLAGSRERPILEELKKRLQTVKQPCRGLEPILKEIAKRADQTLSTL
jgi:hypothetical protein